MSRPSSGGSGGDLLVSAAALAVVLLALVRREGTGASPALVAAMAGVGAAMAGVGAAAAVAVVVAAVIFARRHSLVATHDRPEGPGWANRRDLLPLLVRQVPGDRIVVGSHGRRELVAAERRQSVLVVGPSQSGKTSGIAIPAICAWDGPVLATSVKADLLEHTLEQRRRRGRVAVYDPAGSSRAARSETEGWSPLVVSGTWPGARRMASAMCSVAEADHSMEDAGFWYAAAEKLLAPLLFAAASSGGSISDVVRWIDDQELGEPLLALELAAVPDAVRAARTSFSREDRQRSSVFSTAEAVVAGFADPAVASSAEHATLDPRALVTAGPRRLSTLYCCAPARGQERLRPLFTALVREVLDAAFAESAKLGGPLEPGLLVVLDEAANVAPLAELDGIAATAAGHGIALLTVWQDMAQIEARYARRWSTIVNNHRGKVICAGSSDALTLEHVELLMGEQEGVEVSTTMGRDSVRSRTESPSRRRLAAPGSLRRLPRGEAVLLYGTLPPARVRLPAPEPERRLSRPSTRFSHPGRFQRPRLLHPGWARKRRG